MSVFPLSQTQANIPAHIPGSSQAPAQASAQGTLSQVVSDRHGNTYQLLISSQGDRHSLQLYDGSTWVGAAHCSWQTGGWMMLDDIAIANQAQPRLNPWERFQQWLGWEWEPVNYRQRGLGTILLACTVEHARRLGASVLQGEVFQPDVDNTPNLLDWYNGQGFVQSAPWAEQIDVVANITLQLRAEAAQPTSPSPSSLSRRADQSQLSSSNH